MPSLVNPRFGAATIPLPARFVRLQRDDQEKLCAVVSVDAEEIVCPLSLSGLKLGFLPTGYWYTTLLAEGGKCVVNLADGEYYRFRAEVLRTMKRSDLFF